jgi:hypothetical protein
MASIIERYNVAAGRPYATRDGQDKKQWVSIGRAVKWDDGGISIEFTSIPVGNWWDGKASLFVQDDSRQQGNTSSTGSRGGAPQRQRPAQQQPADDFDSGDIPFASNRGSW